MPATLTITEFKKAPRHPPEPDTGESPMRTVLIVACAAAFIFSAWSNMPTSADTKSAATVSPLTMMTTATNLPSEQFDAY